MSYKISVLFVCTGNSVRSRIAEALLRHTDSQNFEVASAGTNPKPFEHTLQAIHECIKLFVLIKTKRT